MHRKDKNNLFIVMYAIGFLAVLALMVVVTQSINLYWIGLIVLVAQQLYITPMIQKHYYRLTETTGGGSVRFLPLFNETSMFPTIISNVTLTLGILIIVLAIVALLPMAGITVATEIVTAMFGDSVGMNYTFYAILFLLLSYVLINFTRGLGFIEVKRTIDGEHARLFSGKLGGMGTSFEALQYIMLFVPVCRVLSLVYMLDRLNKMMVVNDVTSLQDVNFVEEG
jgi:hypothetical protein